MALATKVARAGCAGGVQQRYSYRNTSTLREWSILAGHSRADGFPRVELTLP